MKKMFTGVICLVFFLLSIPITQAASSKDIRIFVDEQLLTVDPTAYSENGTTMVPFRPIFAKFGLEVGWDKSKRMVTGKKPGLEIYFTVGETRAVVNGKEWSLPVSTKIIKNTVFVPLRFVGEATGNDVRYHHPSNAVHITTKPDMTEPTATGNAAGDSAPADEIRIMSNSLTQLSDRSPYYQSLQSNTHLKFSVVRRSLNLDDNWIEPGQFTNVDIVDTDYGFDTFIEDPDTPVIRDRINEGYFWDLTDKLKNYQHLMQFPDSIYENIKMQDGRIYGIPKPDALSGGYVQFVRKDWLDKLGLPVPRTLDELYVTAKAFASSDPDGNGKNDTYGMLDIQLGFGHQLNWIYNVFNESNGRYKAVNGKVVDTYMEKGTRNALIWLRNAYADRLIPRNYDDMYQSTRMNMLSKVGISTHAIHFFANPLENVRAVEPTAEFVAIPYWQGPTGKIVAAQDIGIKSVWMIPKVVEEAKVDRILAFADYLASEAGQNWRTHLLSQIPQKTNANGYTRPLHYGDDDIFTLLNFLDMHYDRYEYAYRPDMTKQQEEAAEKIVDEMDAAGMADIAIGLYSKYRDSVEEKYNFAIQSMQFSVIKGERNIEDWDALLGEIRQDPEYQAMIRDFNESYRIKSTSPFDK